MFPSGGSCWSCGLKRPSEIGDDDLAVVLDCIGNGELSFRGLFAVDDLAPQFGAVEKPNYDPRNHAKQH